MASNDPPMKRKIQVNLNRNDSKSAVLPPHISVSELNQRITNNDPDALNQTFTLHKVHVVQIAPGIGTDFVVQNRNNQKITYCAKVGLKNHERTGITAKTWNAPMEQLTRTKVEQFQKADDAGKIQILENIDTGVSCDSTIKITEWNGRFEATVVRLTPV